MRTRVGYAGGADPDPTYRDLGDHTEALQLDFDPNVVSYPELLAVFWKSHRPHRGNFKRQYMAAVFASTRTQLEDALASRAEIADTGVIIETPVISGARFYIAEEYHQKYHLRQHATLMNELADYDPHTFVCSTVAARLNGYVTGHGTPAQLETELDHFGLSRAAAEYLRARVARHRPA